jgi:hypothetical protein
MNLARLSWKVLMGARATVIAEEAMYPHLEVGVPWKASATAIRRSQEVGSKWLVGLPKAMVT